MINIVDLFCGCGGSAIGVERVPDTKILLAIDCWDKAVNTYNLNCRDKVAEVMDITKVDKKWLDDRLHGQRVDIVMGGPPCQGFSTTTRHKWENGTNIGMKEKNYLFKSFLNVVDILKPKLVIMENVKGILTIKNEYGEKIIDEIVKAYNDIGYYVKYQIVHIHNLGLPQHRDRVIFFATQDKNMLDNLTYPTKVSTHYIKDAIEDLPLDPHHNEYVLPSNCNSYVSSLRKPSDVLTNHIAPQSKPITIERIKQIKQGQCMKDLDNNNPYKTKAIYNNNYLRQKYSDILVTQVNISKNMFIHPKENRIYTVREALRLQNFPDSFSFSDDIRVRDMYQMVANSIPPILMEEVLKNDRNRLT